MLCCAVGLEAQHEECIVESLIRTGLGLFKVQLAGSVIRWLLDAREVTMGILARRVEKMRDSSAPSIVLMGVDQSLPDKQVVNGVMKGSCGLLPEAFRGRLVQVRTKRMFSATKGAQSAVGSST